MPGCSPGVTPHCPVGERVFSTPPFQASKFVWCSWPLLPGHFQLELQLRFDISERPLRAWLGHSARHPRCSDIPLSIHFPKSRGLACAVLFGEGAWEPLARAVTEPLFRRFPWPMLPGLSFPLGRGSATLEFTGGFLWHGAPRFPARQHHPAPAPRARGTRDSHGTDFSLPEPGVLVALAPQGN